MSTNFDYDSYPYTFNWDRKPINNKEKKNLLFIFPWFKIGGADKFNFDLISNLNQEEYEITIVTTEPCDYVWRQKFEQYATIFDLTSFLHRKDWPAFIHYIMKSRNIDLVFQSQSYFGYYVLPWLKSHFPETPFVDYVHAENWSWRNGEYPRDSTAIAQIVDKTYTCTKYLKNQMAEKMGRTTENVETVYIGVDTNEFNPDVVKYEEDIELQKAIEKHKNKKKILFCCRISIEKRPILAIRILKKLYEKRNDVVLFVVGDGPMLQKTKREVNKLGLEKNVEFFGSKKNVKPFYKACDVELICSLSEGLTLTTYEAMAMKTPVVSAHIGGQGELIDSTCGRLVKNIQSQKELFSNQYYDEEIENYANAILEVLGSPNYDEMCEACRKKVLNGFSIQNMIEKLDFEIKKLIGGR